MRRENVIHGMYKIISSKKKKHIIIALVRFQFRLPLYKHSSSNIFCQFARKKKREKKIYHDNFVTIIG